MHPLYCLWEFDILQVFVSKINNDRKHIKLEVLFNFNNPNEIIEIDTNNYNNPNNKGSNADEEIKIANGALTLKTNRKYNINLDFEGNFLRSKYLLQATKEPGFCKDGAVIRQRNIVFIYRFIWFW